jgi:ribosomal protein S18 acetylase RimI-like enzyme
MKDLIIAPYTSEDREAVIEGNIDLQETERKLSEYCLPGIDIGELYLDHLLKLNREQSGVLLVAKIGGRVVGFISCRIEKDESVTTTDELNTHGYISDAWTHPEFRNQGIFKALNTAAEEYLAKLPGISIVKLNVLPKNTPAIIAYGRAGYRIGELTYVKKLKKTLPQTA